MRTLLIAKMRSIAYKKLVTHFFRFGEGGLEAGRPSSPYRSARQMVHAKFVHFAPKKFRRVWAARVKRRQL